MRGVRIELYESPRHIGERMLLLLKLVVGFVLAVCAVWIAFWVAVVVVYLVITIVESIAKLLR